jgi:hypothetical protein
MLVILFFSDNKCTPTTLCRYVANWASLLGPSVEGFAAVRPSTDPSLSASRDEGTLWVSISCGAWRGVAWRGVAWRGVAWRGMHSLR